MGVPFAVVPQLEQLQFEQLLLKGSAAGLITCILSFGLPVPHLPSKEAEGYVLLQ